MNEIIVQGIPKPQDPQLAALVNKVTRVFQLEIMSAVARLPLDSKSEASDLSVERAVLQPIKASSESPAEMVHRATRAYFGRLPAARRNLLVSRFVSKASVHDVLRTGVISSPIDFASATPILSQVNLAADYAFLADEKPVLKLLQGGIGLPKLPAGMKLSQSILDQAKKVVQPADTSKREVHRPDTQKDPSPVVMDGLLELRLNRVTCITPTKDGWFNPANEIAVGGATTDDQGKTGKIPEFYVGGGFKKNVAKAFNPPAVLRTFSLKGSEYPKIFTAALAIAEKDNGGFAAFIEQLYTAVKEHIDKILMALGSAAGAAIGAKIGGTIGMIGGPLGSLIGIAAGMVLGALVGWLTNALKDDIFEPRMAIIAVPGSRADFDGTATSPVEKLDFYGHGGHFRVNCSWRVKWG